MKTTITSKYGGWMPAREPSGLPWKGPVQDSGPIQWSGIVTSGLPVVITFRAEVPHTSDSLAIVNQVQISREGSAPIVRQAVTILNPYSSFLPIVLRQSP